MKSNVRDQLDMAYAIYRDACAKCIAEVFDLRDLMTIRSRVEKEGLSFLTISLPAFSKDFQKALQLGYIAPTDFRSFRKFGSIPAFLRGMIGLVFDHKTGRIYDEKHTNFASDRSVLIDSVRQVCLAFEKIELPCSPKRIAKALANFTAFEHTFQTSPTPKEFVDEIRRVSACLWDNSISRIDCNGLIPRHGPGATADRMTGNRKYVWQKWHERLEPYFPIIDSAYCIGAIGEEILENVTLIKSEHEQPVRVVCVPKTLKGPRIIAIEPCCMQYAQQAIRHVLYDTIESSELTKGHVNFRDQSVNQKLALISSSDGLLATIDLSDASDRVPRDLALEMFQSNPSLRDAIDACRSTRAELPDGSIIGPLKKFASMGSALCFPVESMYFYTICVAALLNEHNLPVSQANIFDVSRDIYVYGDDIIVPSMYAMAVLDYLQKYYCKVNISKTFVTGKFRESCGMDAYDGEPVTPVRIRRDVPKNRRQVHELISWVATANLFYQKGYWQTAQLMRHTCERILGSLPYVSTEIAIIGDLTQDQLESECSALGWVSYLGYRSVERWNRKLQRFEIKAWSPRPVYRSDSIDGYPALQKFFLNSLSTDTLVPGQLNRDHLHLERSALHGAVALIRHWVPA